MKFYTRDICFWTGIMYYVLTCPPVSTASAKLVVCDDDDDAFPIRAFVKLPNEKFPEAWSGRTVNLCKK